MNWKAKLFILGGVMQGFLVATAPLAHYVFGFDAYKTLTVVVSGFILATLLTIPFLWSSKNGDL